MIPIFHFNTPAFSRFLKKIKFRGIAVNSEIQPTVSRILEQVRKRGDRALFEYSRKFDQVELKRLRISPEEIRTMSESADRDLRRVIRQAARNIRDYHKHQLEKSWEFQAADGVKLGQRIEPLRSVGLYVPGGTAAYPSTVLMNAIPAQIAGVPRIVVTTPYRQFKQNPMIAAVFQELGLEDVYGIGGAQAIAALAYGTETIAKVDKIVGPGNIFVATAKRLVYGVVDIDSIAGPSEVIVVADHTIPPQFVAADLLAQAEHDPRACAIAMVRRDSDARSIQAAASQLMLTLKRKEIIRQSLRNFGAILVMPDWDQAAEIINSIAPEHLELLLKEAKSFSKKIHAAGAIFLGSFSCEAVGDYFAGPNHVLPTSGTARFASPLGVYDFLKRTSVIQYNRKALSRNHRAIEAFARTEQLDAHAQSIAIRMRE
ncbi:MAG: histidinol dehydrogenase [Terriglobia bacterium]